MLFVGSASLVAQNPAPSFEILNQQGSSVYKLLYKATGKQRVNVKVYGANGVLYSESLNFNDQFILPLDFKEMNKGNYTVEVSNKNNTLTETIDYDVKLPKAYVHVAKQPNDKYLLSIKSQLPTNFTVRIYDRWNNEVLEKSETVSNEYALLYNLSRLSGPFNFEVTSNTGDVTIVQH